MMTFLQENLYILMKFRPAPRNKHTLLTAKNYRPTIQKELSYQTVKNTYNKKRHRQL